MKPLSKTTILCCITLIGCALESKPISKQHTPENTRQELPKLILDNCSKQIQPRCLLTISCRDTDIIPKSKDAGKIFVEDGKAYQCMHNGIKVLLGSYHSPWMNYIIQELQGHHEPQEELAFFEVLKNISPGGAMLELGSSWAYYSMWFLKNGGGSCYLLEPLKECLEWGRKNFELNGLSGTFIHGYITDASEKIFSSLSMYLPKDEATPPSFTIDEIVSKYSLDKLAMVHADVQGAELSVLRGSQKSISNGIIDYFFISTHGESLHKNCLQFLTEKDFHIVVEHTVAESASVDGLIVAEAPHVSRKLVVEVSKR